MTRRDVALFLIGLVALPLGAALGWLADRVWHGGGRRRTYP